MDGKLVHRIPKPQILHAVFGVLRRGKLFKYDSLYRGVRNGVIWFYEFDAGHAPRLHSLSNISLSGARMCWTYFNPNLVDYIESDLDRIPEHQAQSKALQTIYTEKEL